MKFFLLLFLLCIQNKKLNLIQDISITFQIKKENYKYDGYDYRNYKNETNEQIQLHKIQQHFQNKKLLDILKNENISFITKVLILNDNTIKPYNLFAGGLMKDFDFEF